MSDKHAVVIGSGVAGCCAAKVLSRYYDRVTILERDGAEPTEPRPGLPQAGHVHVLLERGRRDLEALFPGFASRARAAGAASMDIGRAFAVLRPEGWAPREATGIESLFASRRLLESILRSRLARIGNVECRWRTRVTGLRFDPYGSGRVTGVVLKEAGGGYGGDLFADLVVDTSGRGSVAPRWLREAGLEIPSESRVESHLSYSTRWYRAPESGAPQGWQGLWLESRSRERRAAVLYPVEDRCWIVTLISFQGTPAPRDAEGFATALEELPSPLLARTLRDAEPQSDVLFSRSTANRMRHYERLRWPMQGFVALGDAVAAFNPLYGQGMSCAVSSARILERWLDRIGLEAPELPRRFFQSQADWLRAPWQLATASDFRNGEACGRGSLLRGLRSRYQQALTRAAFRDPALRRRQVEIFHMLRSPDSLRSLQVAARVAWHALRSPGGEPPAGPPRGLPMMRIGVG